MRSDVFKIILACGEDLEETLKRYCWLYKSEGSASPIANRQSPITDCNDERMAGQTTALFTKGVVNPTSPTVKVEIPER